MYTADLVQQTLVRSANKLNITGSSTIYTRGSHLQLSTWGWWGFSDFPTRNSDFRGCSSWNFPPWTWKSRLPSTTGTHHMYLITLGGQLLPWKQKNCELWQSLGSAVRENTRKKMCWNVLLIINNIYDIFVINLCNNSDKRCLKRPFFCLSPGLEGTEKSESVQMIG